MRKRIWSLILVVALLATAVLTGVGCDDPTDPYPDRLYMTALNVTSLSVFNGTDWVVITGSGGGGGGATVLGDLTDVFDTAAVEGDMLYYDQVSGTWLVGTRAGLAGLFAGVTILGDLADVSVIGPADDTFLYYDLGTGLWKFRILADADIPAAIARDAEVAAAVAAEAAARAAADTAHNASTTGVHGVTGTVLGTEDVDDVAVDGATTDPISSNWAYDHNASTTGVHGAGANTLLHTGSTGQITYDLCEAFILPYILYRNLTRFMHVQFDSYDMIAAHTAGTGYTVQSFFNPRVRSGATSGGESALYQNAAWLYIDRDTVFAQSAYYISALRDGTGFLGLALVDNTVIAVDEITKHAGFVFYVSGATQTVYAQSGDGVGVEKTDLSVDPTAFATWSMIGDGSTIKFYRNWSLVATHNTRIPAGALCWKISVKSAENQDNAIDARDFVYGQVS